MKDYSFKINGNLYQVNVHKVEQQLAEVEVNGTRYQIELVEQAPAPKTPKLVRGKTPAPSKQAQRLSSRKVANVLAPLPGTITELKVKEGDSIKRDQVLLLMEAMKMENQVLAESEGEVKSIKVTEGENVLQGQVLIELA